MQSSFFAIAARMKYIERWALMRNARPENLSEHSLDVAMIAHALATLANVRYKRGLDANKAAVIALYHDMTEIITGDMPTPVKYASPTLRDAYKQVEKSAATSLIEHLPKDLQDVYATYFFEDTDAGAKEHYLRRLIKAADRISALIKCIDEKNSGNKEFDTAYETIKNDVDALADELPEVKDFVDECLGSFGETLDTLL